MSREEQVLEVAERYLREQVAPRAADIDADPEALREALEGLCNLELMALRRPEQYGGPALSERSFRYFQEQVARYSGTLAFLQTQHQSAGSMISKSPNENLKREYLPRMGNGERLLGIGFSQLRRAGPPILTARQVTGGYVLDGEVPWITGYSFIEEFVIGAALPDGRAVFGVVPFEERQADHPADAAPSHVSSGPSASGFFGASSAGMEAAIAGSQSQPPDDLVDMDGDRPNPTQGSITLTEPIKLAAMEAALTVSGRFKNWFLPDHLVCFVQPQGWIQNNDMINIVLQGHFALGCARGSLDVLQQAALKKALPFLTETYEALDRELEECRAATLRGNLDEDEQQPNDEQKLQIRAWAIDMAVRCAHAAVAASSGAANSVKHPAQRLYREALVYTVSAQTTPIMEATLRRLVGRAL